MPASAACTVLLGLWLALLAGPAQAEPPFAGEVEKRIATAMERHRVVGLSAAVVVDHRLAWSRGFGTADLEHSAPAGPRTVYRLASVSKPVTAVAAMLLVEEGKLDLDQPVEKYVPAWPRKEWTVTPRQLLAHLGGVRHYASEAEIQSTRRYPSLTEALGMFKDDPLVHEPGTKFRYSSYGYNLLGCVVEGASGKPFVEFCRERIFKPAGMERTGPDDVAAVIPGRARGYRRGPDGAPRNSALIDTSNKIPGGGLVSTAEDMARFAIALQTGKLLRKETLEAMFAPQKTKDGTPVGYGLGWSLASDGKVVRHGGSQQGTRTILHMVPDRKLAVVVLCNTEGTDVDALAAQIAEVLAK